MRAGDGSPRARVAQQQPQPQEQPQFRTAIAADATAIDGSALATSTPSFKKLARVVQRELGHRDMQGTPRIPAQRCADRPERKASAVNALSALVAESVCMLETWR